MKVSTVAKKASMITLQIILDRLLKYMIKMKKEDLVPCQQPQPPPVCTLNMTDRNVVHYMAGYTAFQLLKRYKRKSSHPAVQQKRQMFVSILKGMKSDGSDDKCTSEWTKLIDRGGLFQVNTHTYEVMELLECKVRQHLHSTTIEPNQRHQAAIIADVVNDKLLLEKWEKVVWRIPAKYEMYSLELLKEVARLWTTIHCNSFAKCYSMQQHSTFSKHGTRKTLKSKGTDKESN